LAVFLDHLLLHLLLQLLLLLLLLRLFIHVNFYTQCQQKVVQRVCSLYAASSTKMPLQKGSGLVQRVTHTLATSSAHAAKCKAGRIIGQQTCCTICISDMCLTRKKINK